MEQNFPEKEKPKFKFNIWMGASILLLAALIISILTGGFGFSGITGAVIASPSQAAEKAIDFINENLIESGEVTLKDVSESNGMYEIKTSYQGKEIIIYVTKDGKKLFAAQPIDMTKEIPKPAEAPEQTTQDIPKTDKPKVELFIMSFCPYGTQAQKALLPVWELLKDKADFNIRFVYYAMHGEKELDENLRQFCIQKEQPDKYIEYMKCFLKEGKYEDCLNIIDKAKLESDMKKYNKEFKITESFEDKSAWLSGNFPLCNIDKELNEKYDVAGSPTLIINGKEVSVSRSPEAVKTAVCNAFNSAPKECSQKLSTDQASPGFGFGVGTTSSGGCG